MRRRYCKQFHWSYTSAPASYFCYTVKSHRARSKQSHVYEEFLNTVHCHYLNGEESFRVIFCSTHVHTSVHSSTYSKTTRSSRNDWSAVYHAGPSTTTSSCLPPCPPVLPFQVFPPHRCVLSISLPLLFKMLYATPRWYVVSSLSSFSIQCSPSCSIIHTFYRSYRAWQESGRTDGNKRMENLQSASNRELAVWCVTGSKT